MAQCQDHSLFFFYNVFFFIKVRDRDHCGDLQLPMQLVPITTNVVISNPAHGMVYPIQHYVIKFVSDLRQVSGILWGYRFPPSIKLTATM